MGYAGLTRVVRWLRSLTVEPLAVLYYMGLGFLSPTDNALWYWKVCLHLHNDVSVCQHINTNESYAEMEQEVQSLNSQWNFYRTLAYGIPSMVVTFLYGSWSDRISRKLPMLLPLFGLFLNSVLYMISSILTESSLGFLLVSNLLVGIFGGLLTMLMSTMSYVSDISTPESRTLRISVLYASSNIGALIANTLSGVIFDHSGFIVVYSICITLSVLGFLSAIFLVEDIKPQPAVKPTLDLKETEADVRPKDRDLGKCARYCDLKDIKDAVMVTFKKRENNHRLHIVAILVILFLYVIGASTAVQYLYLKHPPLEFSQTLNGFFGGWSLFIMLTVNGFFVPLLKKRFNLPDVPLLILALISHTTSTVVMALSTHVWMVFLVPVVGYISYGIFTFLRSVISSMVRSDELGKIFAVFAVLENFGNIVAYALYSYFMYPYTIAIFAGFCYLFQSFVMLIPIGVSVWLLLDMRKRKPGMGQNEDLQAERAVTLSVNPPREQNPEDVDTTKIDTHDVC